MRKWYVPLGILCMSALVGCSEDPNDKLISDTISVLKGTTTQVEQVAKTLAEGVAQAKKDQKPLGLDKIAKATEEAGLLRRYSRELQRIKGDTEFRKENITKDQQKEYAKKHKDAFQRALADLDAAQKKLDTTLREADVVADNDGKAALEKLREKLKEEQAEFEVLTKRQV